MTRVNERIRVPEVRVVVAATKEQVGILPTRDALRRAKSMGLDLVEIAPTARPPVCYIVDYGKYKYEQSKLKKDKKPKAKIKEVKFRVRIDTHDYGIKMMRAEDFLSQGDKLRVQLMFRGREMAHKELGFELMKRVKEDLAGMAHCDLEPRLSGRQIVMMFSPLPAHQQKRKFRSDDEAHEIDFEAHEAAEREEDEAHAREAEEEDQREAAEAETQEGTDEKPRHKGKQHPHHYDGSVDPNSPQGELAELERQQQQAASE